MHKYRIVYKGNDIFVLGVVVECQTINEALQYANEQLSSVNKITIEKIRIVSVYEI